MKKVLFGLAILMAIGTTVSASNTSYCYKACFDKCMKDTGGDMPGICNSTCKKDCE